MGTKKEQRKAGSKQKPRGQQTGFVGQPDQNREEMKNTPALRGRRKAASKMFGDESAQQAGTDAAKPRSNQPSLPAALPTNTRLGESNDARAFKQRQKAKVKRQK
jgi:hypothetical protein